jgi:alpha-ribazole phosphatase
MAAETSWVVAPPKTIVYLARHARPEQLDDRKRFLGQTNLPLGATGLEQAHKLAERLRPVKFDAIYSSDLLRCRLTAEIVAEGAGMPVFEEPRLREIDTGLWQGLTVEQVRHSYPTEYAEREADVVAYAFPGGESFLELQQRAVTALHDIVRQDAEQILVIAHLGVNRALLAHLRGLPLRQLFSIRQDYCDFEAVAIPARF